MKKLILAAVAALSTAAFAESFDGSPSWTCLQVSLASPLHVPCGLRDVDGLRLNLIYGDSQDVTGCDLGLVNHACGNVTGLQLGGYNWNRGLTRGVQFGALGSTLVRDFTGVQVCGLVAMNAAADTAGVQVAPFAFDDSFRGVQLGLLNWNFNEAAGCQLAAVNVNRQDVTGASLAVYNTAHVFTGCQIGVLNTVEAASTGVQFGVINCARNLTGVQIGAININEGGCLQMMAVVNMNF